MSDLLKGQVKWFNSLKGFGFIGREDGKDVFVHFSAIDSSGFKTLKEGENVLYQLQEGEKGLHAAKVIREKKDQTHPSKASYQSKESLDSKIQKEDSSTTAAEFNKEEVHSELVKA